MSYYPEIIHIEEWRHKQKLIRTYEKRPDLLEKYELTNNDKEILETYKKQLKTISVMLII